MSATGARRSSSGRSRVSAAATSEYGMRPSLVTTRRWLAAVWLGMVLLGDCAAGYPHEAPKAHIVVTVRKRRDEHWDFWQLNSNVCPPSLCQLANEVDPQRPSRPLGTGGSVFYQGDIVLDREVGKLIYPQLNHTRHKRALVRLRSRLWKDGEVPYVLDKELSESAKQVVLQAINHISQRTCIKFRDKKKDETDYISFISDPGCWSAIGRAGGKQMLSLGRGCENLGTAVHELVHSLGAWHEQARNDRDKYVRILEENISDRFLKDFEMVTDNVSNSRGFPYDYHSVTHYSRYAFTRNGKPTMEVVGVGREMNVTLKQRAGLSPIDVAQLRDLYRCNLIKDTLQTSCPEGWVKHETACYRFSPHPKRQFSAAVRDCHQLNSHLVFIEDQREHLFLARHLRDYFPFDYVWRIGAKKINDTFKWYREDDSLGDIDFTHWGPGQPDSYTTAGLQRNRTTNETHWVGLWAGSVSQLPHFIYPYICERRARRSCLPLRHQDGRDYRGKLSHTVDGFTCQRWTDHYPHHHNLTAPSREASGPVGVGVDEGVKEDAEGLGAHNYCRNPSGVRRGRPWCFTSKRSPEWQFCDVLVCAQPDANLTTASNTSSPPAAPTPPRSRSTYNTSSPPAAPTPPRSGSDRQEQRGYRPEYRLPSFLHSYRRRRDTSGYSKARQLRGLFTIFRPRDFVAPPQLRHPN